MFNKIEVSTKNGFRRTLAVTEISSVNEVSNGTLIYMNNGKYTYCADNYELVLHKIEEAARL